MSIVTKLRFEMVLLNNFMWYFHRMGAGVKSLESKPTFQGLFVRAILFKTVRLWWNEQNERNELTRMKKERTEGKTNGVNKNKAA